jgi:DNA-binding NarL/FixJ family response regulator
MDLHIPWTALANIPGATDDPDTAGVDTGQGAKRMTTVMLVEDDPSFLHRFCKIVVTDPGFELFAAVGNLASARQALLHKAPDVLITDLGLPDGNGIELIRETAQRYPATDIMVITVFGDERHVLASIEAGATGYLLKSSLPEEFIDQIKQLVAGGSPISPLIARQLLKRFSGNAPAPVPLPAVPAALASPMEGESGLSPRESEVLSYIAKGFSFGEIAKLLAVSPHTVTAHVKKIYQKLAVHSRGEAVYEAGRMGLI